MKLLWGVILTIVLVISHSISFADEIRVDFPINVKEFKEYTKQRGFDLNDVDGFVENKGQKFIVYTYKTLTPEQMEIVKDATFKNLRK